MGIRSPLQSGPVREGIPGGEICRTSRIGVCRSGSGSRCQTSLAGVVLCVVSSVTVELSGSSTEQPSLPFSFPSVRGFGGLDIAGAEGLM